MFDSRFLSLFAFCTLTRELLNIVVYLFLLILYLSAFSLMVDLRVLACKKSLYFIGKLAALIPPPRLNLTRFFGVFAPNSNLRAQVTASQRGKNSPKLNNQEHCQSDKPYHAKDMSWAQRLKRVFNIDITECEKCQKHNVTIIACITEPAIVHKILKHLDKKYPRSTQPTQLPPLRAPPKEQYGNDFTIQRDFNFGA